MTVLDMNDTGVAARAKELGVGSLPAVAIDGRLASCCAGRGPDLARLREAGPAARLRFGPARWRGSVTFHQREHRTGFR